MYKLTDMEYSEYTHEYMHTYICDTETDASSLPEAPAQSTCLVAETGAVYIVNASGNWVKMGG